MKKIKLKNIISSLISICVILLNTNLMLFANQDNIENINNIERKILNIKKEVDELESMYREKKYTINYIDGYINYLQNVSTFSSNVISVLEKTLEECKPPRKYVNRIVNINRVISDLENLKKRAEDLFDKYLFIGL